MLSDGLRSLPEGVGVASTCSVYHPVGESSGRSTAVLHNAPQVFLFGASTPKGKFDLNLLSMSSLSQVINYFNRREDGEKISGDSIWLEANGAALKMYVPIGVLYDQQSLENDAILEITVRTSSPPADFMLVDRNMMESMFMQSIKEADYLKTKAETTNNMQKEEYAQLWRSVTNSEC